jgi:hypothetical protein
VDTFHMLLYFCVSVSVQTLFLTPCMCLKNVTILEWIVVHMAVYAEYIPYRSMNEFYACMFTVT